MRTIKSFVLRAGRTSDRQQNGLKHYYPKYQLTTEHVWDFQTIFDRQADTIIEIGFGMGSSLAEMAKMQPQKNFIGIEVHEAGIGSLSAYLYEHQLENVKIAKGDAVELIRQCVALSSVAGFQIFFPDPWPKKKHHKRRLVQSSYVELLVARLQPQGFIHCATDWQNYAEQMYDVLHQTQTLANASASPFMVKPDTRPLTKFEKRGQQLGHGIWDVLFYRR